MSTVPLGSAVTNMLSAGAGEIRVGALEDAGNLTQANSIGGLQDGEFTVTTTQATAKAGSPLRIVGLANVEQTYTLKGTTLEKSYANLNIAVGNGYALSPTDVSTTMTADELAGSVAVEVASAAGITAGAVLTFYPEGRPELTSIGLVASVASNTVTLNANTPLLYDMPAATDTSTVYRVFVSAPVAGGKLTSKVHTFSASWLRESASGRPIEYVFWKVAAKGNFTDTGSPTEFAKLPLEFDILTPSAKDVAVGGPLHHVAALIAKYPTYMIASGADI